MENNNEISQNQASIAESSVMPYFTEEAPVVETKEETTQQLHDIPVAEEQVNIVENEAGILDSNKFLDPANTVQSQTQEGLNQNEEPISHTDDCKIANIATDGFNYELNDPLYDMPYFPDSLFPKLPALLYESCNKFENKRERDVYFISALPILSGCFDRVTGEFGQRTVYPNLYSFVVAPPASGKGVMVFAKQLGGKIHSKLVDQSNDERKKYELELKEFKAQVSRAKKEDKFDLAKMVPPVEPPFKVLFIPGDVSSSRMIDHLHSNGGSGIFCETEADTMALSLKQDWGGFSDKLRKAYHHEPIAYSRKGSSEFKEVDCPRLSIVLSGTPSQVGGIIRSVGDGLFSRVLFYTFKGIPKWRTAFSKEAGNLTTYFDELGKKVDEYSQKMSGSDFTFILSDKQQVQLDSLCEQWLKESYILIGEEAQASSIRMGLNIYRIAMTLTILRYSENQCSGSQLLCSDNDFEAAIEISRTLKSHTYAMLKQMPNQSNKKESKHKKFLDVLSSDSKFRRPEAIEKGKELGLSERTIDYYLRDLLNSGLLELPDGKPGIYRKTGVHQMKDMKASD